MMEYGGVVELVDTTDFEKECILLEREKQRNKVVGM